MSLPQTKGYKEIITWMKKSGNKPFDFQKESWEKYADGFSGIVNAPTGFGKTFSVFLAVIIEHLNSKEKKATGLQLMWITPLRSLAKDLKRAMQTALDDLEIPWKVGVRNGDTPTAEKQSQVRNMPQILIITPETLHLLLAQKNHENHFANLKCIAVDEWHELLGSKRGVMAELAISRVKGLQPALKVWGISATIGNIEEALDVLVNTVKKTLIFTKEKKQTNIISIVPEEIDTLPWAGHMGLNLAAALIPIIEKSNTTLIFTNTRGQSEVWYQKLLNIYPDIAGAVALHHGSIDHELRTWIEDALHENILEAVICTSSLDLGVDFKPVDTVIQIGSPKGVARFLQRAGRSGHSPHEASNIYFLPTHSLELVEAAALKAAEKMQLIESRTPMVMTFDVLIQYLVTLAVGNGFDDKIIYDEVKSTHAFNEINDEEWSWIMQFITVGGTSLGAYEEFKKVEKDDDGLWKVKSKRIAMNHRMNMGAIVSAPMLKVKYMGGSYIGMVEEYFASRLNPGDAFVLAGSILEFVAIKEMTVQVRKSKTKKAISPSWLGGRVPLSSNLSRVLRQKFTEAFYGNSKDEELIALKPLFAKQESMSHVPKETELLVEKIYNREGFHLFIYPFEGRLVHEVLASLVAYRLSLISPITFSIAMNDYGFELLTDVDFEINESIIRQVMNRENLLNDIQKSINAAEMARRKFRDIATIAGLILPNNRGKQATNRNLQASAGIFFNVFEQFDPSSLLLRQAYDEVFYEQLEEPRLAAALQRIQDSDIIIKEIHGAYTPLSFPIKVDSMRNNVTSESLEERIKKMKADMVRG